MLRAFSLLSSPRHERAYAILSHLFNSSRNIHHSIGNLPESSIPQANQPHGPNFSGIAEAVISKCSLPKDCDKGEEIATFSLKDYLIKLSNAYPTLIRRFWRESALRPQDVLQILQASETDEIGAEMVRYFWGIFNWASEQYLGFEHFPRSCKIMASMLARVGLFREVEMLLSRRECRGIMLDCAEVFNYLIVGYVRGFELDNAISVYMRMRDLSLVPSMPSFQALITYLIDSNATDLMYQLYVDMISVGMGIGRSVEDKEMHENVIRLLCTDGKVQESRDLVKKFVNYGIKPSNLVVNAITCGYCDKKDYNDLLNLFAEVGVVPDFAVGNKILFSLCRNFGVDQAGVFLQKLEELGFCPDEITLGILIGFCCRERNLKRALLYVSDILSRGLKPQIYSYNAILSALFTEGLWRLSGDILAEMNDAGVMPVSSTFKVLLAGFCKARKFDEAKAIVHEMADRNLLTLSLLEDPLIKGLVFLGYDPLSVRIRRDNDNGFPKTEFYDNLGNGLYLDANLDEFEKRIALILYDSMVPDFSSSLIKQCHSPDLKSTLMMVDEITKWGQEMTPSAFSSLLGRISGVKTINHYLGILSKSTYQLDEKTLNTFVQAYSRKGFTFKVRALFDGMLRRGYLIEKGTLSVMLLDTSKKGDLKNFQYFYKHAQKSKWSPEAKDGKALLSYLCQNKWINEALDMFETLLVATASTDVSGTFLSLLGELCCKGFSNTAIVLLNEFSKQAIILDQYKAYNCIIHGFCGEKISTKALELFETMHSKNLSPPLDISTHLISCLCQNNNIKKAIELKNTCLQDHPSAEIAVNSALIRGLCKRGSAEEASSLFREMLLKGLFPDADVCNSLIEGYCRVKNLKKVRELLGITVRKNFNVSASCYSSIARLICAEGRFAFAMMFEKFMLRVASLPKPVLHNILIFHISSLRDRSLLDAALKKGLPFDEVTYTYVVRGYLMCNDVSRSLKFLRAMIKQGLKPRNRTLREVIHCLCRNREVEAALKLSREMESRCWIHNSTIQTDIVEALLSNGNLQEGTEYLARIGSKALIPNNVQYNFLIKAFCQHGRPDTAVDLLNTMLKKGNSPSSTSYDYLIQSLCKSHELETALDFYAEMLCREMKLGMTTWDIVIRNLSEYGRVGEAENVLKTAIELGVKPSREAFCAVIDGYRVAGNVRKTGEVMKVMQEKGYVPDFDTHWSVVKNMSNCGKEDEGRGFLSGILSGFGFSWKNTGSKTS